MQFRDLKAQYEALKPEIDAGISEVINSTSFILGKKVTELENMLAEYVGRKHCIGVANGTDALQLALMVMGVGVGDAVFTSDFTYFASAGSASILGATPILVDIDLRTFNISPEALEEAIKRVIAEGKLTPKVIVPVDLFGLPADYEAIEKIAEKYGLKILEDGAQGFGGSINGKRACSFGDISTTSFFPAKPLGCYGDGGAIFCDNDEDYELLTSIRVHGKGKMKYDNVRVGLNSRLDTIQAAILLPKLKAFGEYELEMRNKWAKYYTDALKHKYKTPFVPENYVSSWAQYTLVLESEEQRNALQAKL
ncbi:MAG: DegT/DnrJ/EryC1/StrS family aminotransferase, partial [Ruminococcaceae bacterium]|nr:DegT/DnrJ/EryC1/StrS family aminotransferase [Oscillospiraceae bacterium]